MLEVSLGIDVEPDCPPYLATQYRGIREGLPRLLDALDGAGVATTCFCTGQVAEQFPSRVEDLLRRGHELGAHGHTHRPADHALPGGRLRHVLSDWDLDHCGPTQQSGRAQASRLDAQGLHRIDLRAV